jgi:SAM-dependent methyltransferase
LGKAYEYISEQAKRAVTLSTGESAHPLKRIWTLLTRTGAAERYIEKGPVIDIGCGNGELVYKLVREGIEATGVEFDLPAVSIARQHGVKVVHGDITKLSKLGDDVPKDNQYAVLSHVLEHVEDPIKLLVEVSYYVKPGGKIIILVPNQRSLIRWIFGRFWHGWDPPFHLTQFTPDTLKQIGERATLSVDLIKTRWRPDDLQRSLNLWMNTRRRYLVLRIITLPLLKLTELFGLASEVEAVFIKDAG